MPEPVHVIRKLEKALADDDFAWSLVAGRRGPARQAGDLTADLRGPFSETGDGKQVPSGFSYWGIAPTIAWANACKDPLYLVMKVGTNTFGKHWRVIRPYVENALPA